MAQPDNNFVAKMTITVCQMNKFKKSRKVSKMEKNRLKELFGNIVINPKDYYWYGSDDSGRQTEAKRK